jgi:hypothetical protein
MLASWFLFDPRVFILALSERQRVRILQTPFSSSECSVYVAGLRGKDRRQIIL